MPSDEIKCICLAKACFIFLLCQFFPYISWLYEAHQISFQHYANLCFFSFEERAFHTEVLLQQLLSSILFSTTQKCGCAYMNLVSLHGCKQMTALQWQWTHVHLEHCRCTMHRDKTLQNISFWFQNQVESQLESEIVGLVQSIFFHLEQNFLWYWKEVVADQSSAHWYSKFWIIYWFLSKNMT